MTRTPSTPTTSSTTRTLDARRRAVDRAGPATLEVPEGEVVRRVDRFVADRTGLSRSYVQKLITDGPPRRRRRPPAARELRGRAAAASRSRSRRPRSRTTSSPTRHPARRRLRGRRPADRRQAVRASSSIPRPATGTGTLVNALLARAATATAASPASRGRASSIASTATRRGLLMVARNDAAQALAHGPAQGPARAQDVPRARPGLGRRRPSGGSRRRSAATPSTASGWRVVADGRRADDRLPGPRAVRRLDAARARPRHRADPPDPRPPRRRSATRSRATRSTGPGTVAPGPDGLERLFLHAWRLELVSPSDGALVRAEAPLPPTSSRRCSTGCGRARLGRAGDRREGVGVTGGRRGRVEGAPGALLVIISGPSGVGKDTIIDALRGAATRARRRLPLRRDLHDPRRRGPARSPACRTTSSPDEFHALRDAGELLEANEVHGNWYGTPRREVARALARAATSSSRSTSRAPGSSRSGSPTRSCLHRPAVARGAVPAAAVAGDRDGRRARAPPAQRGDRARPAGRLRPGRGERDGRGRPDRRRDRGDHRAGEAAQPDRRIRGST